MMLKNFYVAEYLETCKKDIPKTVYNVYTDLLNNQNIIFRQDKADKVINFIETFLKHSKGKFAGQSFKLMAWQRAFVSALYGSYDITTEKRAFKEAFLLVGRKNGKSSLAAGLCLYELLSEPGSEVYTISGKQEQAGIIFDTALDMVSQCPALAEILHKRRFDLTYPHGRGVFRALSSNADSLEGLNISFCCVDEAHILDRAGYDVLKRGQSMRETPLLLTITTAGTTRGGLFDELYQYSKKVLSHEVIDPTFLPVLYELDNPNDWDNSASWVQANPSLGTIKSTEALTQAVERAKASPENLINLKCKDLNILENSDSSWLTWNAIENKNSFKIEDFKGTYCVGAIDLSYREDLTAAAVIFVKDGVYYVHMQFFMCRSQYEEKRKSKIPYEQWVKQGYIKLSGDDSIDFSDITRFFVDLHKEYEIIPLEIAYDPWGASYLVDDLKSYGFKLRPVRQGALTLSPAIERLECDMIAHKVNYNNNPVLAWCLVNSRIARDRNNNKLLDKKSNQSLKIDGAACLVTGWVSVMEHERRLETQYERDIQE